MEPLADSSEVYNRLVVNSDDDWALSLLAFAVVEENRFEWMEHQKESTGSKPTVEEIKKWYAQQPEIVLIRARTDAQNALIGFTEEAISSAIQKDRENFRKSTVINEIQKEGNKLIDEIQKIGKFWPQLGKNIAYSFISSVLFTLLTIVIIYLLLFNLYDISLSEMIKYLIQES